MSSITKVQSSQLSEVLLRVNTNIVLTLGKTANITSVTQQIDRGIVCRLLNSLCDTPCSTVLYYALSDTKVSEYKINFGELMYNYIVRYCSYILHADVTTRGNKKLIKEFIVGFIGTNLYGFSDKMYRK